MAEHNCTCGHEHHHHHDEIFNDVTNNFLNSYSLNEDDKKIGENIREIIANKVLENDTKEVKKFLFGSIELTSLNTTDSEESILAFTERVNSFDNTYPDLPHVATICVYPNFAQIVKDSLEVDGVELTCVGGCFPSSQSFLEVKIAEVALALRDGATEIDIVMPVGKFLNGNYEEICEEISEIKAVCGNKPLKVILETGSLKTSENIYKASLLAMYAGADYIKTSTGKEKISATPEAVYVMCKAIKNYYEKTDKKIGLKPAGGINTTMDATIYYTIVKEILGKEWLTNKMFRIGTSRLANLLLSEITDKETHFF